MSDIKMWRYALPTVKGEGWGIFLLDSTGMFAAFTDYGNYCYKWTHHGKADFRIFLLGIEKSASYVCEKLGGRRDRFMPKETVQNIKERVIEYRRDGSLTKERAREEWDLVESIDFDDPRGMYDWVNDSKLSEAYEYLVYDFDADLKCFVKNLLPRLSRAIEADLIAEGVLEQKAG